MARLTALAFLLVLVPSLEAFGSEARSECNTVEAEGDAECLGAVALLQTSLDVGELAARARSRAARGRQLPDVAAVWEQLKGSVEISNLEQLITKAASPETTTQLRQNLAKLREAFPSADELQVQFSDVWENVTKAVDMESVQEQLQEAQASGSAKVAELQKQYDAMKTELPDLNIRAVKDEAATAWAKLQGAGITLPDLNNISAQARAAVRQAEDAAQDAMNSASDALSNTLDKVKHIFR